MTTATNTTDRELIDAAVAEGKVTKVAAGKARGVTKKTAPMTTTRKTKAQRDADGDTKAPTKRTRKAPAKRTAKANDKAAAPAKATRAKGTITAVDIAAQHDMNPKTLRARIRRNIEKWEPLFADGERHVFKDNVTTRKAIAALLDA